MPERVPEFVKGDVILEMDAFIPGTITLVEGDHYIVKWMNGDVSILKMDEAEAYFVKIDNLEEDNYGKEDWKDWKAKQALSPRVQCQ